MENSLLESLRGSGLNGLVSFDQKTNQQNINLIRPLLKFSKKNLEDLTKKFLILMLMIHPIKMLNLKE